MASPFRFFRKYVKPLLVVLGVLLMFVFVIGDSLVPYLSDGGDREGGPAPHATAVSWDGGELTNDELRMLVYRRRMLMEFLVMVESSGRLAAFQAGNEPRPLRVEMLNLPVRPEQYVEQNIVQARVLSQAARAAGMVVSNEDITQYLSELGRGNVTGNDMRVMIGRMQGVGGGADVDFFFNALREELLARNYLASYHFAFATSTPEQHWQDWLRLNDRVTIEAAALPVESFVVDVPDPTEEQLVAFYSDYKDREPQPAGSSPMPAFKIPRKLDLKFIVADYDKFVDKVASEVTDEEVEQYYEEKKDPLFIKTDTSLFDIEESEAAQPPAGEEKSAETEESAGEATENTDATETSDAATGSTEVNGEAAVDSPQGESDTGAAEEAEAAADQESDEPATEDSSQLQRSAAHGVFRLAAFLQDEHEDDEGVDESTRAETPTDEAPGGDSAADADQSPSADNEPVEPARADAPADTDAAESDASATDIMDTDASTDEAEEKPLEFQPLEEVRDEIRRQLAEERAAEQLIQLMDQLRSQLNDEFNDYFSTMLDAEAAGKPRPQPPAELVDLEALAQKHGLESSQTGLESLLELRDNFPIGRSVKAEAGDEEATRELLLQLLLQDELELYEPVVTVDIDGNRYVAMKVDDVAAKVPALDEIRDEVVRAWKLKEAATLAQKHAEEVATEAQRAGTPLSEYFADDPSVEVVKTDPFAQFTGGTVSPLTGQLQPLRLDAPDVIVAPGLEFMQEVFSLKENEVGAVLNNDHSIAYVVRIVEHELTPEELHQDYLAEAANWDGMWRMIANRFQIARQVVVADLLAAADVQWEREPDPIAPVEEAVDEG